tara:strand:- start:250 stop:453 length:204 start_codon:yes stop_codon:yes gene_type:complete
MATEVEIKVCYKSGQTVLGWFTEFEVFYRDKQIAKVTWACAELGGPIHLGVDNIESIWQTGRERETQ